MSGPNPLGLPQHVVDQLDAASLDARMKLTRSAAFWGDRAVMQLSSNADAPWADKQLMARIVQAVERREIRWCPHMRSPRPCALFAWETPWTIRCPDCLDFDRLLLDGDADRTCDVCGFVEPETIMPRQFTLGPVIVSFGACHACARHP